MFMKKFYKRLLNTVVISVLVLAFNIVAFAQGTTSISVSKNSPAVGDSITVSVTGTENGSITVKYTSSMLSLSSCSVSGYKAEGNSVTFSGKAGDLVFSTTAEGTASIIVSSTANSGSSTTLTIGGSGAASSNSAPAQESAPAEEAPAEEVAEVTTEEEAPAETTEAPVATSADGAAGTLNSEGGFDIGGVAYVVSERYSDSEMPSGFSKTTIKIGSSTYSEPTNGTITLLYLKPADNTAGSGVFYLYDEAAGAVYPFLMLGSGKNYVILSTPTETLSSAFTATTIEVTGGAAQAYTIDGAEFFYVYGANQDGATGWFLYDKTYGTISRVDTSALTTGSVDTSSEEVGDAAAVQDNSLYIEKLNLYRKIIMGLIVLCVVLLFVLINKAIKGGSDDDEDFDGDVFAKTPVKSSKRLPRSIVFSPREKDDDVFDDEDDEDDDDDAFEDEDVEEEYYDEDDEDSYETKRSSSLNMMDLNDL
jgi:hypothetical protein